MKDRTPDYLIEGLLYIAFGIALIFIPREFFSKILGIILIISNLQDALIGPESNKSDFSSVRAYILILLGLAILIWGIDILVSIWGFLILFTLTVDLLISKNKIAHVKQNLIKYLFAFILIALGLSFILNVLLYLTSAILIIYGLFLVITTLITFYLIKRQDKNIIEGQISKDNDID